MLSKVRSLTLVALLGSLALAASHHSDHDHDHDHPLRLLISDAASADVRVFDLEAGRVIASFTTPGPARVYPVPGGAHAVALHREQNRVTVVHSGYTAEDHGDHQDLVEGNPYVVFTANLGAQPTHFFGDEEGGRALIFNDGDGTVAVLDPRLFGLSLDYGEIETAGPDHGALGTVGDFVLVGSLNRGVVDVHRLSGERVYSAPGCPRLHGSANAMGGTVFGCADGVLWVGQRGGNWESVKIANPAGTAEGVRVGTVAASGNTVVGNWGAGIALIDLAARRVTPVALSERPVGMVPHGSGRVDVLTRDGRMHRVEGGAVRASVNVYTPSTVQNAAQGSVVEAAGALFVAVPHRGELLQVSPANYAVQERYRIGGQPQGLAPMGLEGVARHHD